MRTGALLYATAIAFELGTVRLNVYLAGTQRRIFDEIQTKAMLPFLYAVGIFLAFALLFVTGIWNLFAVHVDDQDREYLVTLFVKLVFVALSGVCAALHVLVKGKPAVTGALAGGALLFALGATFTGIQLHG